MNNKSTPTIAAIATPPGQGGVGIVRISGPLVRTIATAILGAIPEPRHATLRWFLDQQQIAIDQGIAIFFPTPHSYTGEDVLELHGHGGRVVLDLVLQQVLALGAILARAGEFTERAYLAGKLDLTQAEAIADLIASNTAAAAKASMRTLQGAFSKQIYQLKDELLNLRLYIEGALDFSDEDVNWIDDSNLLYRLNNLIQLHQQLLHNAQQGRLLRDGLNLVIAGATNAGKSSLLNALAGKDIAIVTPIPGTTRDLLYEHIQIDGMPIHIVDTAGIRDNVKDLIEIEGIRRAKMAIEQADHILWVFDDLVNSEHKELNSTFISSSIPLTLVRNKIDLTGTPPGLYFHNEQVEIAISAAYGIGLDILRNHLKNCAGFAGYAGEFIAQRRHINALEHSIGCLEAARTLAIKYQSVEVIAEELRHAQNAIGQITGEITSEDLLAEIFAKFCIGK